MWAETVDGNFLNLDLVELISRDGEELVARLASGATVTLATSNLDERVITLRKHLVANPSPIGPLAFRSH